MPTVKQIRITGLLEVDLCAGVLELLLSCFSGVLCDTFEHLSRSAFDELLRVGKTEARSNFTNCLNDSDLVATTFGDNHVEFGLFFSWSSSFATTTGSHYGTDRSCSGYAPSFFKFLNQISSFQYGKLAEFFCDFI